MSQHFPAAATSALTEKLSALIMDRDTPVEFTHIVGGRLSLRFSAVSGRALHEISQAEQSQFSVLINSSHVEVTFDSSMEWKTPDPFSDCQTLLAKIIDSLPTKMEAQELPRRRAGATHVLEFKGGTIVPGELISRILATTRVIDVKFKAGAFTVMIAREHPIVGGLAHLAARRKISGPTMFKKRNARVLNRNNNN